DSSHDLGVEVCIPVHKNPKILCLKDYHPVALTSTIMKCFEQVSQIISSPPSLPDSLDPLQFANVVERRLQDGGVARKLPGEFHPRKLLSYIKCKITAQRSTPSCPPSSPSSETSGSTAPCVTGSCNLPDGQTPGCADGQHHILHPDSEHRRPPGLCAQPSAVCTPCSRMNCVATNSSNTIIKFTDDTTVIGLITGDAETAYREPSTQRRRQREEHAPLSINGTMVERVSSFRFLRVHISEDLTWTHHTDFVTKSARQWLFFPRSSCTTLNRKALQRVVKAAQHIASMELPSMEDPYSQR
ncbi:hypothetical protein L3Q82_018794, partial [Scortum barcoo]